MKANLTKWQRLHMELVNAGEFFTARRLLGHVANFRKYGRCSISLANNDDWVPAGALDPGHNGYTFKLY